MKTIQQLKQELKEARKKAFKDAKTKDEVITAWNEDKRSSIPKEAKLKFCSGCRQNYYNGNGAKECWSLDKSKLCKRKIHKSLNSVTPNEVITLNCYIQEYK